MSSLSASGMSKGRAVRLGERGHHEDDEAGETPWREHVPVRDEAEFPTRLVLDDAGGRERAREHHDWHPREEQRKFVADELRERPHRGEQRVFVVARPAGHEDGEFGRGAGGKEVEHRGVEFERHKVAAVGNHREGENGKREQRDGREEVQHLVRIARHEVLLGQRLYAVGERLREAVGADFSEKLEEGERRRRRAIRAGPVLHAAEDFSLGERQKCKQQPEDSEDDGDRDDAVDDPAPRLGQETGDRIAQELRRAFEEGVSRRSSAHAAGGGGWGASARGAAGNEGVGEAGLVALAASLLAAASALAAAAFAFCSARIASTSAASVGWIWW